MNRHLQRIHAEEKQSRELIHRVKRRALFFLLFSVFFIFFGIFTISKHPAAGDQVEQPIPTSGPETEIPWNLILVNREYPLPLTFTVSLESVENVRMDSRAASALSDMLTKAREANISLTACSGYRSVKQQKRLYEESISGNIQQGFSEEGAQQATQSVMQPPGSSEHHTGLAVDLQSNASPLNRSFAETEAYQWLSLHAWEYGFIERYPQFKEEITEISWEPWHYRYVGREFAQYMVEQNLCLEEYCTEHIPAYANSH